MLTYKDVKNLTPQELVQKFKNLAIELAEAAIVIHNAAVAADERDELEEILNAEEPWVKSLWKALDEPAKEI